MLKNLIALAVTSGLAATAFKLWLDRKHRQRQARAQHDRALHIQRWEHEGGSLAPTDRPASDRADARATGASRGVFSRRRRSE